MVLSEIDRNLLQRCLARKPRSWEDFCDRFLGMVVHVVNHSAQCRSIKLAQEDREDLTAEVFLHIIKDDFALLRRFRGDSSLATYLTVVSRRIIVRELLKRKAAAPLAEAADVAADSNNDAEERINNRDEVEQLMQQLDGSEAEVVRMYHLEGKTYREISQSVGLAENTIGPTLSRARAKMRRAGADAAT